MTIFEKNKTLKNNLDMAKAHTPPKSSSGKCKTCGNKDFPWWPNKETNTWWYNDKDSKIPANGIVGPPGSTPQFGPNGNWWINGVDTGHPYISPVSQEEGADI